MSVFVQGWAVQDMDKALLMVLRLEMDRKSSLLSDTGRQSCSKQDTGINIFFKAAQATASPWKVLKEQCMRCHRTQAWTVEQRQVVFCFGRTSMSCVAQLRPQQRHIQTI